MIFKKIEEEKRLKMKIPVYKRLIVDLELPLLALGRSTRIHKHFHALGIRIQT